MSVGRLLWWLGLVAVVLVPLAFNPWQANAFELPKALLLRALAGGCLILLLIHLARGGRVLNLKTPLVTPALAAGAALVLATLFSVDSRVALWGTYQRQFGLATWLALLALFLGLVAGLQLTNRPQDLYAVLVWTSAPIVVYALIQAGGLDPFRWVSDGATPLISTLGRSNFLGSYLVMIVPLTVARLLRDSTRWPYGLLLLGQMVVLVLAQARAAWVGIALALLVFGAGALALRGRRRLLLLLLILLALGAVLFALWLPASGAFSSGSIAARLTIWRASLPLLQERPWLGYGPETMEQAFAPVFPPELVYYQGRHLGVDRAHNVLLDLGLSGGLVVLASFAWLLVTLFRTAVRRLRQGGDRGQQIAWLALSAAVAGHLADLQFSFETAATATVFWSLLALASAMATGPDHKAWASQPSPSRPLRPFLFPALIFLSLILVLTVRPWLADVAYLRSQKAGPTDAGVRWAFSAVRQWPLEPEYHVALGQHYWQVGQAAAGASELIVAAQLRPQDPRLWAALGDLYARWGAAEPERLGQGQAAYERALTLAPNRATYHAALGLILAQRGQLQAGAAELERAVALDATDATAYEHLAGLYRRLGQAERAAWAEDQASYWAVRTDSPVETLGRPTGRD